MSVRAIPRVKRHQAFTLIELLVAMIILAVVGIAAVGLFFSFSRHFEQSADLTVARQRGEMVLTRLEFPFLHAGLSMPNDPGVFEDVFVVRSNPGVDLLAALRSDTRGWDRPVFLPDSVRIAGTDYYKKIGIVYSLGSGVGVLAEGDAEADQEVVLDLSYPCPGDQLKPANFSLSVMTDYWVSFSGCQTPFIVKNMSANRKRLTVVASKRDLIPQFSELQYIRAMSAYVNSPGGSSPSFYVRDVTRSPAQPIVEGVSQALFSFDEKNNLLTVHLLLRGNRRFLEKVTLGDVSGWPLDEIVTDEDRHYRLIAMTASWRVRN
ncbi:type II secretion system protein [Acetomicrobium sp.]|uniref:PilW family protein n=1 Tax=Acetomicrobium sp. TaxID=1872099 RepID=UPI003157F7F8